MAKNYHGVPHENGWGVKGQGNFQESSVHRTQADAFQQARGLAQKRGGEVVIHRRDGQIRERNTYGSDPYPPEG